MKRVITSLICSISCLIAGLPICIASISCMNDKGTPVDWWTIIKLPDGLTYLYYDSHQGNSLYPSTESVDSSVSTPGYTLSQIYGSSPDTVGYALYNDEFPDGAKGSAGKLAHSKGVVGYDSTGGFWLVHSVPRFPPPVSESYSYPDSGIVFGQSMLCISLSLSEINQVGRQLQTNGPSFYDYHTPQDLIPSLQDLYDASVNQKRLQEPPYHIAHLVSKGGKEFTSFAKSKEFNKDLYSMLVAPTLEKSLFAETWIRGERVCSCSVCHSDKTGCEYEVDNVVHVSFGQQPEYSYESTHDHSKWAVSKDRTTLCIGDINRMTSQFKRGGGTVCFAEHALAAIYESAVRQESCPCDKPDTQCHTDDCSMRFSHNTHY